MAPTTRRNAKKTDRNKRNISKVAKSVAVVNEPRQISEKPTALKKRKVVFRDKGNRSKEDLVKSSKKSTSTATSSNQHDGDSIANDR